MQHPAQPRRRPVLSQKRQQVVPAGIVPILGTAMNQDRPLASRGYLHLPDKTLLLNIVRSALVVVIQPNLPAGNHFRLAQQPIQFCQRSLIRLIRIVRINPGTRIKPWHSCPGKTINPIELAAKIKRLVHLSRSLANTNG